MNSSYDVAILGAGLAGTFAALKITKTYPNAKIIMFELGSAPQKRRSQISGFLGCLPNSDGKIYLNDLNNVSEIAGTKKTKAAEKFFNEILAEIDDFKTVKDKLPSVSAQKRIVKSGFDLKLNDYIQLYPKEIHSLSKYISNILNKNKNLSMSFNNEALKVEKDKNQFTITSEYKTVIAKKIIVCTGRAGWRWTKDLYDSFGIIENNDYAKFGIRVEAPSVVMKDFNKSNCSIFRENLEIGPLCWNGTVIPEDHMDLAIAAFRSNENRWKSDKVSFNMIGNIFYEKKGFEQTNRIATLTFVLANERIVKEKLSTIVAKKSKISIIPEYDWLSESLQDVSKFMPDLVNKAHFHTPAIFPLIPKINLSNSLSTDVEGIYTAGESAGVSGILAAATMGIIAADGVCKEEK